MRIGSREEPPDLPRVVCLGEAVVDFVPDSPVGRVTEARAFVPSFGGSQANVAVGAARLGARATLAGCSGNDPWGVWLEERLAAERVDTSLYRLSDDVATTIALVALAPGGEPEFSIYGGAEDGLLGHCEERLRAVVAEPPPGVIAFGSDTLIVPADRQIVGALKRSCVERRWRVLYDPNLREGRWSDRDEMLEVALEALRDVTVVKANEAEAAILTGHDDPASAASALVAHGPRQALVTVGAGGAFLADGAGVTHFEADRVRVADTTGAGDAVAAVAAAALARQDRVTPQVAEAAMRVAGAVVAARGALTGFPRSEEGAG